MDLISMYQASKLPGAPPKQTLSIQSQQQELPAYFQLDNGVWKIDTENKEWLKLIKKRISKKISDIQTGQETTRSLQTEILKEKLNWQKIENKLKRLKLEKEENKVVEFALANYLFLGFMSRIASEFLALPKKIEHKIDLEIIDGYKASKATKDIAKKIRLILTNETERIIREIKKAQSEDLEKWEEEEGAK